MELNNYITSVVEKNGIVCSREVINNIAIELLIKDYSLTDILESKHDNEIIGLAINKGKVIDPSKVNYIPKSLKERMEQALRSLGLMKNYAAKKRDKRYEESHYLDLPVGNTIYMQDIDKFIQKKRNIKLSEDDLSHLFDSLQSNYTIYSLNRSTLSLIDFEIVKIFIEKILNENGLSSPFDFINDLSNFIYRKIDIFELVNRRIDDLILDYAKSIELAYYISRNK